MSNEKIYVGSGKAMNGNFGTFHKLNFSANDLETMKATLNAKGYITLNMNERKSPSQYGDTHSMTVDLWQPDPNYQSSPQPQQAPQFQQPQSAPSYEPQPVPGSVADPVTSPPDFPPGGGVNPDDDIPFARLEYV